MKKDVRTRVEIISDWIVLVAVTLALPLFLATCTHSADAANIIRVGRQRTDYSDRTIARLGLDVACGVLESSEKAELLALLKNKAVWFPDGEVEASDISGALALAKQVRALAAKYRSAGVQVWLDGALIELDAKALRPLLKRLAGFIADTDTTGSIEYRYSLTVRGLPIERWCRITDGQVHTTATIRAAVYSRYDRPGIRSTVNWVQLEELATESENRTTYRTTCRVSIYQTYKCIGKRIGPRITRRETQPVIDGMLGTYTRKVSEIADAGTETSDRLMAWVGIVRNLGAYVLR